ncbi:hypothetical protein LCGC14_0889160 [marine sediment metagenome]|uniref:Uncharacterized protein n=1 Tax=marine sediment metagenome TaxID=412755 RepID=A0A0F9NZS8_9ZZZZ
MRLRHIYKRWKHRRWNKGKGTLTKEQLDHLDKAILKEWVKRNET